MDTLSRDCLQRLLAEIGLPTSGTTQTLIQRLVDAKKKPGPKSSAPTKTIAKLGSHVSPS